MDVVGIGTVAMDVLLGVDALPGEDGFAVVTGATYVPGGSGTNVITQAARLGARCAYVAKVGDDRLGGDILASLRGEGVATTGMRTMPGGRSLSTTVVVDPAGRKFILLDLGDAFGSLTPEEVDEDLVTSARVLYTDLLPGPPATAALRAAHRAGVRTVFNMQTGLDTMRGLGVDRQDLLDVLDCVDVFAPSRQGLADLAGTDDVEDCLRFAREHSPGLVVLTLGARGVVALDADGRRVTVPAAPVAAVDTTGAGDSFIGALLVHLFLDGRPLAEALDLATSCAAITCTRMGARSSPNRVELEQFRSTTVTKE